MKRIRREETPRMGGRTRRLRETRGTGAWVLLGVAVAASVAAVLLTLPDARSAEAPPPVEVWLVRHAEKTDDGRDPALSPAGEARARLLARELAGAGIQRVHSTDYRRTRATAAPVAEALGVEVELYDPGELDAFADALLEAGGVHLVVGHSNTTPALVEALGGDPRGTIDEAEYDRLYHVTVVEGGPVTTELRRYGEAYEAK